MSEKTYFCSLSLFLSFSDLSAFSMIFLHLNLAIQGTSVGDSLSK